MKKTAILLVLILLFLIGCSAESSMDRNSEPEVVQVEGDRVIYSDLRELIAASDLIVIGEYADESKQDLKYEYNERYKKDVLVDAVSTNTVQVERILKGDPDKKELKLSQRYGLKEDRNTLVTFSSMTPMKKGEKWIFFLYYDDVNDTYWCAGDYSGRYPLPESDVLEICKKVEKTKTEYAEWLTTQKDKIIVTSKENGTERAGQLINEMLEKEKGKVLSDNFGNVYYFESDEELQKIDSFEKSLRSCMDEIDPSKFGVYDRNNINLNLYNEIINSFDCY